MVFLSLTLIAVATAIAAWFGAHWLARAFHRYQHQFQQEAGYRLAEFFLFLDPARLWQVNLALCALLFVLFYLLGASLWMGCMAALAGAWAPRAFTASLKRRRQAHFEEQLPDLLMALASALRAGSAVQSALRHIVAQSPAPLGQEFSLALREQRMGVALDVALGNLYRRMPTEGMGLLMASLTIALQSGGNLAETLERIASTLRSRLHLLGRIRALTSQGRMQAWVMAALPVLLAVVLDWIEPEAMDLLWNSWPGRAVLVLVAVLEVAGLLLIRRIISIHV